MSQTFCSVEVTGVTRSTSKELYKLLKRTIVLTIFGNHDNAEVLSKLHNIRSDEYLPVLMEDGRVYGVGGLRVAGINGIIAKKRRMSTPS
jgi:DNA repair exonuclease SbcCD nuclease subunit